MPPLNRLCSIADDAFRAPILCKFGQIHFSTGQHKIYRANIKLWCERFYISLWSCLCRFRTALRFLYFSGDSFFFFFTTTTILWVCVCVRVWADRRDAGVREAGEMTWGECSPPHTEHVHLMNNYHSLLLAVSLAPSLSLSCFCQHSCFFTPNSIFNSLAFPRCPSVISVELSFCQPSISLSIRRSLPDHGQMLACQFLCFLPYFSPPQTAVFFWLVLGH